MEAAKIKPEKYKMQKVQGGCKRTRDLAACSYRAPGTADTQEKNLWAGKTLTGHDCQRAALMREILHRLLQLIANTFKDASAYSRIVFKTIPKISWWVRAGSLQTQQIQPHAMPYKKHKGKKTAATHAKSPESSSPIQGEGSWAWPSSAPHTPAAPQEPFSTAGPAPMGCSIPKPHRREH